MRFFNILSVAKHQQNEGGNNFHFRKKTSQCRETLKGEAFGLVQDCMLRGNLFGSVTGPTGAIQNLEFCRKFGRTILVTLGVSKKKVLKTTDEKP